MLDSVERVDDFRTQDNKGQLLVKWARWGEAHREWVDIAKVKAPKLVGVFLRANQSIHDEYKLHSNRNSTTYKRKSPEAACTWSIQKDKELSTQRAELYDQLRTENPEKSWQWCWDKALEAACTACEKATQ